MSKYISIDEELIGILDKDVAKDEEGKREETYGQQIKRLIKKAN